MRSTDGRGPAIEVDSWRRPWVMPVLLALLTLVVFGRVAACGFVNYDDPLYVTFNPAIKLGLSKAGILWALTDRVGDLWHPMTLLSLLADYQLFGLHPMGYHVHNLLLHTANVVLLYGCLLRMTGVAWRSALIAALFAVHPLRVESVAWVVERKDVSSTFFMLLAMLAYTYQIRTPGWKWLMMMAASLGLSLLAKPMYVTLPFLLLILDVWPLRRIKLWRVKESKKTQTIWPERSLRSVLLEKLPLILVIALAAGPIMYSFALGVSSKAAAVKVVSRAEALSRDIATEDPGPVANFANSIVAYVRYIGKLFYFADLGPLYPLEHWSAGAIAAASAVLLGITCLCAARWRDYPWLMCGWLWYLLILLPVNNVQKFGYFSMADRYTYFSSVGLLLAMVFSIPESVFVRPESRRMWGGLIAGVLVVLSYCTFLQIGYWENSRTLFAHTLQVTKDNYVARLNYGDALQIGGDIEGAEVQFLEALRIKPNMYIAHAHLGQVYSLAGRDKEAVDEFYKAAVLNTLEKDLFYEMVPPLLRLKRYQEAVIMGDRALEMGVDTVEIHQMMGEAHLQMGQYGEAKAAFSKALAISGGSASIRADLERCERLATESGKGKGR